MDRTVTTGSGAYRFQVFVPKEWNGRRPVPVILFLHGAGERGDNNRAQTQNGIRLLIAQNKDTFPCVVVAPQCRTGGWWTNPDMEKQALAALDQSMKEFNGDASRVYLTGLSMDAYGTWDLAQRYPERWAAIAPVCGGLRPPPHRVTSGDVQALPPADEYRAFARNVVRLPAWVFHGENDLSVPVSESRQMVALLFSLKGDVNYTEYPGVGHNSWDYAYKEPDLLFWFLSHKRKK